jgi:hypothetical protein
MMPKPHGAIRTLLEHLKAISDSSGLPLEKVADVLDGFTERRGDDAPAEPYAPMPKRLH